MHGTVTALLFALLLPVLAPSSAFAAKAAAHEDSALINALARQAPGLDRQVLELSLAALSCATRHGDAPPQRYGVIDYSLPSTDTRLVGFRP